MEALREGGYLTGVKIGFGLWGGGEVAKGRRCILCCLWMTLLFFVRFPKMKWFIYVGYSCSFIGVKN